MNNLAGFPIANRDPSGYYLDSYGHVHEVTWWGGAWYHRDVTGDVGAPSAVAGSAIAGYERVDSEPRVCYLDGAGHLHELRWSGGWIHADLSNVTAAAPAAPGSALAAYKLCNGDPRYFYFDSNGHVHEISWWANAWHHLDVTAELQSSLVRGAFYESWHRLGDVTGSLGAPEYDQRVIRSSSSTLGFQEFGKGVIVQLENGSSAASDRNGLLLPHYPYRMTLSGLRCIKDSSGPGSDDVWLKVATRAAGPSVAWNEWRNQDVVPSDQPCKLDRVLYEGPLPETLLITSLGLEVDYTPSADDAFRKLAENIGSQFYYLPERVEISHEEVLAVKYALTAGGVVGGLVGLIVCRSHPALAPFTEVGVYGGIAGGVSTVAIAYGMYRLWESWAPPDPLIVSQFQYDGRTMLAALSGGPLPSAIDWMEVVDRLYVRVTYSRSGGDVIEVQEYNNNALGSKYVLTLKHSRVPARTSVVPDVTGMRLQQAYTALAGAGLRAATTGRGGMVYRQSPNAGRAVEPGSSVTLTLRPDIP